MGRRVEGFLNTSGTLRILARLDCRMYANKYTAYALVNGPKFRPVTLLFEVQMQTPTCRHNVYFPTNDNARRLAENSG